MSLRTPERTALAAPTPAPKITATRRSNRTWQGLGAALIVLGVLAALWGWNKYGPAHEYLAVARTVPVGQQVTAQDLVVVRINAAPGLTPMAASQLRDVVGKTAAVELTAGTLLSKTQLTDKPVPGPGQVLVGIGLPKDRFPGQKLRPGDPVQLVATTSTSAQIDAQVQGTKPPATYIGTVHRVSEPDNRGDILIDVVVADRDAAIIADLAAANRIVVMLAARS